MQPKAWMQCSKSSYRFLLIKDRDLLNALDVRQPLLDVLRDRLVTLEDHDRVAALLAAVELHGGDVDVPLHERRRHGSNMAGRVLIVDNERVVLTGKVRLDTVDGADADAPAADALGHDVQRAKNLFIKRYGKPFNKEISYTQDNQEKEKLFYKEELNKGTWYIITTAFTFIDDKLIKQEVVKEERTFQKCDCNK